MGIVIGLLFLPFVLFAAEAEKARKQRLEDANRFDKPNIHGVRKFATKDELKKAGLL
jgi:hypothetical protein